MKKNLLITGAAGGIGYGIRRNNWVGIKFLSAATSDNPKLP